jgi:hypothetical protein
MFSGRITLPLSDSAIRDRVSEGVESCIRRVDGAVRAAQGRLRALPPILPESCRAHLSVR